MDYYFEKNTNVKKHLQYFQLLNYINNRLNLVLYNIYLLILYYTLLYYNACNRVLHIRYVNLVNVVL